MSLDPQTLAKLAQLSSSGAVSTSGSPRAHSDESPDDFSSVRSDSEHSRDATLCKDADAGGGNTTGMASERLYRPHSAGAHEDVHDLVLEALAHTLGVDAGTIDADQVMLAQENATSDGSHLGPLQLWSVVSSVEQELAITVPDSLVAEAQTVGDLIQIFSSHLIDPH